MGARLPRESRAAWAVLGGNPGSHLGRIGWGQNEMRVAEVPNHTTARNRLRDALHKRAQVPHFNPKRMRRSMNAALVRCQHGLR